MNNWRKRQPWRDLLSTAFSIYLHVFVHLVVHLTMYSASTNSVLGFRVSKPGSLDRDVLWSVPGKVPWWQMSSTNSKCCSIGIQINYKALQAKQSKKCLKNCPLIQQIFIEHLPYEWINENLSNTLFQKAMDKGWNVYCHSEFFYETFIEQLLCTKQPTKC